MLRERPVPTALRGIIALVVLAALAMLAPAAPAQTPPEAGTSLPSSAFSPAFLGMYRKLMEIEDEVRRHAERYGVDFDLARAVVLQESGGNAGLTSVAGAQGYFQVMPATFRSLRVESNIEAGIKYLRQLIDRFEHEDYALLAYNGGPTRVARRSFLPLETLQYVLGVGHYRTVLRMHEASLREHAGQLRLTEVAPGEDWWQVSRRVGLPLVQLRMHNPFLAIRELRAGHQVAYPVVPRDDVLQPMEGYLAYRTRIGDTYFHLATVFDVRLDDLREANGLWRLETVPPGMTLRLPTVWDARHVVHLVGPDQTLATIAEQRTSTPWRIIRDNALWDERITPGMSLRVRDVPPAPASVVHRVSSGDTLTSLARRYGTSISAIQTVNDMGRRTLIRIGERLTIPMGN